MSSVFTDDKTFLWITLSSVLFLPLILVKKLKHLTIFSLLGFATILYTCIIVVIYAFSSDLYSIDNHLSNLKYIDVNNFFDLFLV